MVSITFIKIKTVQYNTRYYKNKLLIERSCLYLMHFFNYKTMLEGKANTKKYYKNTLKFYIVVKFV